MPNDVIDGVHCLACQSQAATGLMFAWCDGSEVLYELDDIDDHSSTDSTYVYTPDFDDNEEPHNVPSQE